MLIDYHIHLEVDTYYAPLRLHESTLIRYVEQALERGVGEIGISEHCYRFVEFIPVIEHLGEGPGSYQEVRDFLAGSFTDQLAGYVDFVQRMQGYGYPVKLGLEVDYIPGKDEAIRAALANYPWDYVLGSVHFLDKWSIDYSPTLGWPERDIPSVYEEYFAVWNQAAASGLFSSMSHPDLVKKFGHKPANVPKHLFATAAETAARAGVAVEVNSAGLRKPVGEVYPGADLLQAFYQAGVPITLGSDAHAAEDVGLGLDIAAEWAKSAGYSQISRFTAGRCVQEPLG